MATPDGGVVAKLKCDAIKPNGEPCKGKAHYCSVHVPEDVTAIRAKYNEAEQTLMRANCVERQVDIHADRLRGAQEALQKRERKLEERERKLKEREEALSRREDARRLLDRASELLFGGDETERAVAMTELAKEIRLSSRPETPPKKAKKKDPIRSML